MPNITDCALVVEGDPVKVRNFLQKIYQVPEFIDRWRTPTEDELQAINEGGAVEGYNGNPHPVTGPMIKYQEKRYTIFGAHFPMPQILKDTISPTKLATDKQKAYERADNSDLSDEEFEQRWKEQIDSGHILTIERQKELRDATGFDNWYDWQKANWGVKWGDTSLQLEELDAFDQKQAVQTPDGDVIGIAFYFDTAWTEPLAGVRHIAEQNPDLRFELTYAYEGYAAERMSCSFNGDLISDWDWF